VKNGRQKAPNSQFSYKNKRPPIKPLKEWIKARGLKYRDKDGRFKKGGINTLAFLISRSIYAQGLNQVDSLPRHLRANTRIYHKK